MSKEDSKQIENIIGNLEVAQKDLDDSRELAQGADQKTMLAHTETILHNGQLQLQQNDKFCNVFNERMDGVDERLDALQAEVRSKRRDNLEDVPKAMISICQSQRIENIQNGLNYFFAEPAFVVCKST